MYVYIYNNNQPTWQVPSLESTDLQPPRSPRESPHVFVGIDLGVVVGSVEYTSTAANGHSKYYHIGIIYYNIYILYNHYVKYVDIIRYIMICIYTYIIQTHHVEVIQPHLFQEHFGGMKWRFGVQVCGRGYGLVLPYKYHVLRRHS